MKNPFMKNPIAKFAAAAAFLAAAGGANAQDHSLNFGAQEDFTLATAATGSVCTADKKNSIQYGTYFYVSREDLDANGIEGTDAFVSQYGADIVQRMDAAWQGALNTVSFEEVTTDPAKLQDFSDTLNARQKEEFDAFEEETGISVLTDTTATGTRPGCAPAP
jgi:hypothetical protein